MSDTMFRDQKALDEFDDKMERYHNMWENGIIETAEIVHDLEDEGYSPIMAARVVYLWMPYAERPVTNVY